MRPSILVGLLLVSCAAVERRAGVTAPVSAVSEERLVAHVEALAALGPRTPADEETSRAAVAYLRGALERAGWEVREEVFEAPVALWAKGPDGGLRMVLSGPVRHRNVLAVKRGLVEPETIVEVAAHYDSAFESPGADDDASGVAALLEIARVAAAIPCRKTIRLCFFAMEEEGLEGGRAHLDRIAETGERVECVLVLDSIGYASREAGSQRAPKAYEDGEGEDVPPDRGDFVGVIGAPGSGSLGRLVLRACRAYAPDLPVYAFRRAGTWFPYGALGDHVSYWRAGIPAIVVTDTAGLRNPHVHAPTDTPDTIDPGFLAAVARAAVAAVLTWAEPLTHGS